MESRNTKLITEIHDSQNDELVARAGVQDVIELRQMLPSNVRLVIGGAAADPHRDRWRENGIQNFASLAEFRDSLGVSLDAN